MTSLHITYYKGHDEVVQVFLGHGAQVDVPDKVSNMSCIQYKLCKHCHVHVLNIVDVFTMEVKIISLFSYCCNEGI